MQRAKDYLLLSILSYCNFSQEDYGKNIEQLYYSEDFKRIQNENFYFGSGNLKDIFYNFFKDTLKKWEVFYIDDRTAARSEKSTGFYSVVFKSGNSYVIAYRGSEKYPIEDAYKDFIETDLKIGIGSKPKQFWNGLEVYDRLVDEFKIPIKNISITGHSLGGGIAQFVSIMTDKWRGIVPNTCTWNSVGINRDGIITVLDFLDYEKILNKLSLDEFERDILVDFKEEFFNFLLKELKREKIIKDNKTLLISMKGEICPVVDENLIKNFNKSTSFLNYLKRMSMETQNRLLEQNFAYKNLFTIDNLSDELFEAEYFIDRVKSNKVYEENVINFCHSEDLTNALFHHIGSVYQVDMDFIKKEVKKKNIFSNFMFLTKSVQGFHYQDVFIPFIELQGERAGMFSKKVSVEYMASLGRKILSLEYCVDRELLADYYSLVEIDNENFEKIKTMMVDAVRKCGDEILYKKHVLNQLKGMEMNEFSLYWKNLKEKLASPYRVRDIYDVILF